MAAAGHTVWDAAPGALEMTAGINPAALRLANQYVVKPVDAWLDQHEKVKDSFPMTQAGAAGDRPPLSAPVGALVAVGLLYVFWGGALPLAAVAADVVGPGEGDPVTSIFLPLLALSSGPLLASSWA